MIDLPSYEDFPGLVLGNTHTHTNDTTMLLASSLNSHPSVHHAYLSSAPLAVDSAPRVPTRNAPPPTKAVSVVRLPFPLLFPTGRACSSCCPRAMKALHATGLKSSTRNATNKRDMAGTSSSGLWAPVIVRVCVWAVVEGGGGEEHPALPLSLSHHISIYGAVYVENSCTQRSSARLSASRPRA